MDPWLAQRSLKFDSSGIRKVFDLAAKIDNPINLSIGQPDFPVPEAVQDALVAAVRGGKNGYSPTQGIPALRDKLQARVDQELGHADRKLFVSSGTSGGLVLCLMAMVDPGDEVIIFDPYFAMYKALIGMAGGTPIIIDTYPDFRLDMNRVADAITPRTKAVIVNSPGNPTGLTLAEDDVQSLAQLTAERGVALISDEIYREFCYDAPYVGPAAFNDRTIVIDGFSKSHAMTGWRVGWVHGPAEVMDAMLKIQQYTFVCAPHPAQWAAVAAMDTDIHNHVVEYRRKRDLLSQSLTDLYRFVEPSGAFYLFAEAPQGSGSEFVERAIAEKLLIIPGNIFSERDTHFRISFAAPDETIQRGVEVLRKLVG